MTTTRSALICMPRGPKEWADAAALWVTAAGWADAARRVLGGAWVLTPEALVTPDEAFDYARPSATSTGRTRAPYLPPAARTLLKDARRMRRARTISSRTQPELPPDEELVFVWQHHDLFFNRGIRIAQRWPCPVVSYVHAPQVWEARQWGVRRPGWGSLVERYGEMPQLYASDVVACVSEEVGEQLRRLGVAPHKILISPMAVDAQRFSPQADGEEIRHTLGLGDGFVVGWIGSFRGFHGIETIADGFATLHQRDPRSRLVLVGSGAEEVGVRAMIGELGLAEAVVFTGAVATKELPRYLAALDVAVVSARAGEGFHYSPIKLREYLSCGVATIAPRVGEIPRVFDDGTHVLLYTAGSAQDLGDKLALLHGRAELRARLGASGRDLVLATATWDVRVRDLLAADAFQAAANRLGTFAG